MNKLKDVYDIIYLEDHELGIDSGHTNERPCLIVGMDIETNGAYVVPLTSKYKPYDLNQSQHRLATGSYIDMSNEPIYINEAQLTYSRLANDEINNDDYEELSFRFQEYNKDE